MFRAKMSCPSKVAWAPIRLCAVVLRTQCIHWTNKVTDRMYCTLNFKTQRHNYRLIIMYTYTLSKSLFAFCSIFTVRRTALHGLCDRNSVCLSVCPSVTLVHCVHTVRPTITISSPYGSPINLVSGDITINPKFEEGHPERGRWMRVGWVRIGDYRPISRRISETVRDTTKVTINH